MNDEKFRDKNTEDLCGAMAKMICAEEGEHPASLKSPGYKEKELQQQLYNAINKMRVKFQDGMKLLFDGLRVMDPDAVEEYLPYMVVDETLEKMLEPENLITGFNEGYTLQDMFCWPEKMMESMFSVASGLYQQRKFSDAAKAFSVLTMMNPLHSQYWIGQGLATQFQKENPESDIEDALNAHYMAMMLDPDNPYPFVYHAECLIMLKQEKVAMVFLDMAEKRMPEGEHETLRTYIESLKKGRR